MWKNTIIIHNILKKQTKFPLSLIVKKNWQNKLWKNKQKEMEKKEDKRKKKQKRKKNGKTKHLGKAKAKFSINSILEK